MARPIDYESARSILETEFAAAEADFAAGTMQVVPPPLARATDQVLNSPTQAYREVLVGCCLVRVLDPLIDARLPYANQGDAAYNGRTLDELVVNPFLHAHQIPASRGPFLSVFRRSVAFASETRQGLRDKAGFDALLEFVGALNSANKGTARSYLRYLLRAFVLLRDRSNIALLQVKNASLEQCDSLIGGLLQEPSGGRWPVVLTVAMFQTIKQCFGPDWQIDWQGINVADRASDVGGDITIREGGTIVMTIEVTERPIDRARVEATFTTKILTGGLTDYLFFYGGPEPTRDARDLARRYFAQGHDMSFLPVRNWLVNSLGTIGSRWRPAFVRHVLSLLQETSVPASLKLAWNSHIQELLKA